MTRHRRRAFTLVELLVVVGIVAILIAILMPALQKARTTAIRIKCLSNQRQAYLALCAYAADFREYPCTMSRTYVAANWPSLSGGEVAGFGFSGFEPVTNKVTGPFPLLVDRHYTTYAVLQCSVEPLEMAGPRPGFMPFWPVYSANIDKSGTPGLWFCYNGPTVRGGTATTYGHNNLSGLLMGAWFNGTDNTWGLSWHEPKHDCKGNPFRPNTYPVSEIGMLYCISLLAGNHGSNVFDGSYEPHDEMPLSHFKVGASFFAQDDGTMYSPSIVLPIRRNVMFGDGHGAYIKRANRNFTPGDSL